MGVAMAVLLSVIGPASASDMPTTTLRLWLKADAITGLSDGDAVASWTNSAGIGYNATNATAASRPKFYANVVNGQPVVRFDGVTNYLYNTAYTHGTHDGTMAVVVKRNSDNFTVYKNILIQGATDFGSSGTTFWQIYANSSAALPLLGNFNTATLDLASTGANLTNRFQIIVLQKDNAGAGTSRFYYNGTLKQSGTGNQNLGSGYWLGGWFNTRMLDGDIPEALIYNSALSDSARQRVEGLLAWKYALTNDLPSDHRWKNSNPALSVEPVIANDAPTNVTATSSTLVGYLSSTGDAPSTVSVYWGNQDRGAPSSGLWQYTNTFASGQWLQGSYPATNVSLPASNTFYYYRFYAANTSTVLDAWANTTRSFLGGNVWVTAPSNTAVKNGANGLFTIQRGATNEATTVAFSLDGSATLNTHYTLSPAVTNSITLPAGVWQTNITVTATFNRLAEPARTITLTLLPGPYGTGSTPSAEVTIAKSSIPPVAYWRFEGAYNIANNAIGVLSDSSGSGHHITTNIGGFTSGSFPVLPMAFESIPSSGSLSRGGSFPNPVPQTTAISTNCFYAFHAPYLNVPDSDDWTQDAFTLEALISPREVGAVAQAIISHYNAAPNRGWFFGKLSSSTTPGLILSSTGSDAITISGSAAMTLNVSNDFYVACSFDRSQTNNGVKLYLKNLTLNGPLVTETFNHTVTAGIFNASAPLIINGYNQAGVANGLRGLFDEIRIYDRVLTENELLVNKVPAPGTVFCVR
jgi:hypothetical protein